MSLRTVRGRVPAVRVETGDAVVEVRDLEKRYRDGTRAVQGVTFDVRRGEIFGLLGANGAGKTTTMRVLGTLHAPTAGTAKVLGLDVAREARRLVPRIGFAMQEVGVDELATVREMIRLHARLQGIRGARARERSEEMIAAFELGEHADRRVAALSGGLKRRADLAASLVHGPEILFLDEPSTGLDPVSRASLWATLRRLRRDEGLSIVMSTHYMDEADALCDRIAIMSRGRIRAIDRPDRLKQGLGAETRVRLRLAAPATAAQLAALRLKFGAERVRTAEDAVEVAVADGAEAVVRVLQNALGAGLAIASTQIVTATLDDVFLRFTEASA